MVVIIDTIINERPNNDEFEFDESNDVIINARNVIKNDIIPKLPWNDAVMKWYNHIHDGKRDCLDVDLIPTTCFRNVVDATTSAVTGAVLSVLVMGFKRHILCVIVAKLSVLLFVKTVVSTSRTLASTNLT